MNVPKQYLGDGVYAEFVETSFCTGALVLTTENGIDITNHITLDDYVWTALQRYVEHVKKVNTKEDSHG